MKIQYTPNAADPRVLKRIRHSYGISKSLFSPTAEQQISQSFLNKHFGRSNDNLGQWLRKQLLVCTDHHYSDAAGVAKKYLLKADGAANLQSLLLGNLDKAFTPVEVREIREYKNPAGQFDSFVVNKVWKQEYAVELANLEFVYEDKSSRLWHPIQNIKTEFKKPLLAHAGLNWHYDIRCCAPTLIHQRAQAFGMDEWLEHLQSFLSNRTAFRTRIKDECELTEDFGYADKTAKIVINALFCGARLGKSEQFKLTQLLNNDYARVEWLQTDEVVIGLRKDITTCWSAITPGLTRTSVFDKNGRARLLPVSSKQKWNRYFELERQVLDAATAYFKKTNNKCFLEHDGWSTQNQVDVFALIEHVRKTTGFKIEVDEESHNTVVADATPDSSSIHPLTSFPSVSEPS